MGVGLALCMVYSSIHLHDQPLLGTKEVDNKWADRLLAAKLPAFQLFATQILPQYIFTGSWLFSELACDPHHSRTHKNRHLPTVKQIAHR